MITKMKEAIENEIYESDIYVMLTSYKLAGNTITLTFSIFIELAQDEDAIIQKWQVTCDGVQEYNLRYLEFDSIDLLDNHCLLWDYNKQTANLFFQGETTNIKGVIADLFLRHQHLTEGLIPFVQYINTYKEGHAFGDLEWLLSAKQGLFADGPAELMQVYEEVLNIYGLKTSLLPSDVNPPCSECKIFLFGGSYIIARDFNEVKLDYI
ncbi:hypothetical protein [Niallia taxi]|uniref:hypothetical protein n=1 Tax=Niallia taxi TaxID=2499688 RepID=UPI00119D724E